MRRNANFANQENKRGKLNKILIYNMSTVKENKHITLISRKVSSAKNTFSTFSCKNF